MLAHDRVLTFNVGSSSLKWSLFDERDARIDGGSLQVDADVVETIAARVGDVDCVAHRIVHGGERFRAPVVIDNGVMRTLEELVPLDALHMQPALRIVRHARARYAKPPHVAVFDTAFHRTLPREASTYAVPRAWREEYGVRRYGFHGLSVAYASERLTTLAGRTFERVLVLHLGSGSSATAVRAGRSVDTTMGMTPLEGIVMATRSGSIDPGALLHLARHGVDLEDGLERNGGLLALAGTSDMATIKNRASTGDATARFARAQFVHSVARHAASLVPALGGLDAIVFTGGIGERDAELRHDVVARLAFLGVALHTVHNAAADGADDTVISDNSSRVIVAVIHAREDLMLLRDARQTSCTSLGHGPSEANPRCH